MFADLEKHEDRVEDVGLTIDEDFVYIVFHSGTASLTDKFLSFVSESLKMHNPDCFFEEL